MHNKKGFAITSIIYAILILFLVLILGLLGILGSRKLIFDKFKTDVMNKLNGIETTVYGDKSGANAPKLFTNMIPIKYENNNWVYADRTQKWYDYSKKEWANAVILNNGVSKNVGEVINESDIKEWYVWIPRYRYQLFNLNNGSVNEQVIDIVFEAGTKTTGTVNCYDVTNQTDSSGNVISETCNNAIVGNWYTHPSFTFESEQLTGFWVGKFETSTTDTNCNSYQNTTYCDKTMTAEEVTIKPNVSSWRYTNVSNFYNSIKNLSTSEKDAHMMKNMEWGAVSYLKQSKYGLGLIDIGINSSGYSTGGGAYKTNINQSTTGNIYGVYDMSGGSFEYVMGNMIDSSNAFYSSSAGFPDAPDYKYYDKYAYDASYYTTHARGKLGDATKETLKIFGSNAGEWYNDYAYIPYSSVPWFTRGGYYGYGSNAGIFGFNHYSGNADVNCSTRVVLSLKHTS